jgi:hypothetical protein
MGKGQRAKGKGNPMFQNLVITHIFVTVEVRDLVLSRPELKFWAA